MIIIRVCYDLMRYYNFAFNFINFAQFTACIFNPFKTTNVILSYIKSLFLNNEELHLIILVKISGNNFIYIYQEIILI